MELFAAWPEPVTTHIRRVYGEPVAIERLGGMSVARVYRARFLGASVIVKSSPRAAEAIFYERVADRLRRAGVPIPELKWVAHLPDAHWLILEDIPGLLPPTDPRWWRPDPRILAVLARLHRVTRDWEPDFPDAPSGAWTDRATDAALTCFPSDVAGELMPVLRALQREAAYLEQGWCWISGDTSPPNWGMRADGSLALFDWELFRRGVPAGDLAPTVPGLGDADAYRLVADRYRVAWHEQGEVLPWSLDALARDVALAKVATVIMLLRAHADGAARVPEDHVARLVAVIPPWLRRLSESEDWNRTGRRR